MRAICLAVLLLGCQSPQDAAQQHDRECQEIGAEPGSNAYVQCRLVKEQNYKAEQTGIWNYLLGGSTVSCYRAGTMTICN